MRFLQYASNIFGRHADLAGNAGNRETFAAQPANLIDDGGIGTGLRGDGHGSIPRASAVKNANARYAKTAFNRPIMVYPSPKFGFLIPAVVYFSVSRKSRTISAGTTHRGDPGGGPRMFVGQIPLAC